MGWSPTRRIARDGHYPPWLPVGLRQYHAAGYVIVSGVIWPREADREAFQGLLRSISDRKCAAFVGSGLSEGSGYLDWESLLRAICAYVQDTTGTRVPPCEDFYEWAEQCKRELTPEAYARFFVEQFGADAGALATSPVYEDLDEVPFTAIVTTNYDNCLFNATRRSGNLRDVHRYPQLDAGYLHAPHPGHIYHIHGLVHPEYPEVSARSVVFARSEYEEAYQVRPEVSAFLYQLVKNHDLLFIGFGLRDRFLMDQVGRIWETRMRQSFQLTDAGARLENRTHYALLPAVAPTKEGFSHQGAFSPTPEEAEKAWFDQYGIVIIRYDPVNDHHVGLARIVGEMRQATAARKLAAAPRVPDLLVAAEDQV